MYTCSSKVIIFVCFLGIVVIVIIIIITIIISTTIIGTLFRLTRKMLLLTFEKKRTKLPKFFFAGGVS